MEVEIETKKEGLWKEVLESKYESWRNLDNRTIPSMNYGGGEA